MATLFVLLGGPGAGKGTQAKRVVAKTGATQVATGDMFRQNLKDQTALGILAKRYMDAGQLVPDSVTIDMLRERLQLIENGFIILDGFPRNVAQAESLWVLLEDLGIEFNCVVYLEVQEKTLEQRLLNRKDGRADDNPTAILNRLRTYIEETAELVPYFAGIGVLHTVNGEQTEDEVEADIWQVLESILQPA